MSFQIAVSESQAKLGPLKLKNFKATGYLGKVNNRQVTVPSHEICLNLISWNEFLLRGTENFFLLLQGSGRIDEMDFSELDEEYVPWAQNW